MFAKLPMLGFALVTAMSSQALAHDSHGHDARRGPYADADHGRRAQPPPQPASRRGYAEASELRHSDLNRDGRVTLREALDRGRVEFRREDRDRNRVLSRREVARVKLQREDQNRDGRVSFREHESALRYTFASFDRNRDGVLSRYELERPSPGARTASWRR